MRHQLREFLGRPVPWGATILSYVGVIIALIYAVNVGNEADEQIQAEADTRARDLCGIVINVHEAAQDRLETEVARLTRTQDYLATADRPLSSLDRALRAQLPSIRSAVQDARNSVDATRPPDTCKHYERSPVH